MRLARAAGLGAIFLGSSAPPATTPPVTPVQASPVVIAGSGYTAGARFYLTYRSGSTQVRRNIVASVAGRYRVVLRGVAFRRCRGLQLTAPGASLRLPACRKP